MAGADQRGKGAVLHNLPVVICRKWRTRRLLLADVNKPLSVSIVPRGPLQFFMLPIRYDLLI